MSPDEHETSTSPFDRDAVARGLPVYLSIIDYPGGRRDVEALDLEPRFAGELEALVRSGRATRCEIRVANINGGDSAVIWSIGR